MMTIETAAARYLQIAELKTAVRLTEESIEGVQRELDNAEERLRELRKTKSELMKDLRAAARDEGQLPLFNVREKLSVQPSGREATH